MGIGPCRPVNPPPIEWTYFVPLVTAVLFTPKGAKSPGSRHIGVIGALVYFLPCETVEDHSNVLLPSRPRSALRYCEAADCPEVADSVDARACPQKTADIDGVLW